jgi:hypothetical protein
MSQGLCEFIRLQTPRDDSYSVKCDPSQIAVVACSSSGLYVSAGVTLGTFARSAEPSRCRLPQSPVGLTRHDSFPFRSLIQAHDTAELGFDLKQVATPRKADLCPKEDYRPGSDHSIRCALSWLLLRNLHDSINCERYSLQTLLTVCALRAHVNHWPAAHSVLTIRTAGEMRTLLGNAKISPEPMLLVSGCS